MAAVLDGASEADLKRMATLWLYSDMSVTDWKAAHAAYDPEQKTQLASFKTVSNRTLSKYKAAVAAGGSEGGSEQAEKPKKVPAKKRKPAAETTNDGGSEDDGESLVKKPKTTPKPRAKKGSKKNAVNEEAEEAVKDENFD